MQFICRLTIKVKSRDKPFYVFLCDNSKDFMEAVKH